MTQEPRQPRQLQQPRQRREPARLAEGTQAPAPAPSAEPARREVTDPRVMRALAHPMRLALLELMAQQGPVTATQAAELLNDSPGNMSWHLQTLAKYGFVEEAGGGRGRSRPWRAVNSSWRFNAANGDPEQLAAGEALEATLMQRHFENLRVWWSQRRGYSKKWRAAAFSNHSTLYLTAEELERLGEATIELIKPYVARSADKSLRPAGALPVGVLAFGHPLPPLPGSTSRD